MIEKMAGHPPLEVVTRSGDEPFASEGKAIGARLLDFWRWSSSDLADNATRGVLAEYLVALAVGAVTRPRGSWDSYDLLSPSGIKIEVKSASRWQTWYQKRPSQLIFGIGPTHGWSAETGEFAAEARRQADVYVFAVLESGSKPELDPLNLDQWRFYVLPSGTLDERAPTQKSIGLRGIIEFGARECRFAGLRGTIESFV